MMKRGKGATLPEIMKATDGPTRSGNNSAQLGLQTPASATRQGRCFCIKGFAKKPVLSGGPS